MVGRRPIPAEPRNKRLPARTRLSLERMLDAALHIVDTEGVEALSMRHLAQALDREAMSLYRYATTKAALLDGVVELVLSELTVNPAADDWRRIRDRAVGRVGGGRRGWRRRRRGQPSRRAVNMPWPGPVRRGWVGLAARGPVR